MILGGLGLLTASRAREKRERQRSDEPRHDADVDFSGVFFFFGAFPAMIQPLIKLLPLTALNDALRATILQGATLETQAGRLPDSGFMGGISFVLALRWFRWT